MRRQSIAAIIAGLLLACVTAAGAEPQVYSMASPKVGGPFALRDANGQRFTSEMLAGKPYVLFFGYTFCPDVCPTTLNQLTRLRRALGEQGDAFAIVFVTVDPARDDPAVLRRYLAAFHTPVIGLTGSPAEIQAVTRTFRVFVRRTQQPDNAVLIEHSGTPYLMGKHGEYRALLSGDEAGDLALVRAAIAS